MVVEHSPEQPAQKKSRKKLLAILIAGVLVIAGGVTATVLTIQANERAYAEETLELCLDAIAGTNGLDDDIRRARLMAEHYLPMLDSDTINSDQGLFMEQLYIDRPATEDRPSGQEFADQAKADGDALKQFEIPTSCITREDVVMINDIVEEVQAALEASRESTQALEDDYMLHREEQRAIAEAKKAAEEEAERIAAEEAAAAAAAAEAANSWQPSYDYGSNSGGGGGSSNSGGGGGGGSSSSGGGGSSGGGQIVIPLPPGASHTCPEGMNCGL